MKNAIRIMNKINRLILVNLGIIFLVVLFHSCKHDNFDEFVGPGHCPSAKFQFTQPFAVSAASVNLSATPLLITASFNEAVSWTITIKGNVSGAVRKYSARSAAVNVAWYGEPGSTTFFQAENVTIEFKISCKDILTTSVNVTATNDFTNYGVLVSDFEGKGLVDTIFAQNAYSATGWGSYWTSAAPNYNMVTYFGSSVTLNAPQGSRYLTFKGQAGPASWFLGGFYGNINLGAIPTNNPDSVYFNAFINSNGNSTTLLGITLGTTTVQYAKTLTLDATPGWKLVSFKLSEFVTNKVPKGLPLPDTWIVTSLDFAIQPTTAQGQSSEINMDFVIFTKGGPLY